MVVFNYIKKPVALLLALLIIISTVPVLVLFAGGGNNDEYIEVYDPFAQLRSLIPTDTGWDNMCAVDFSGSNFSVVGSYDGVKNAEFNSGLGDSEWAIFTDSRLNNNNVSFRAGGWYNAMCARQSYNGKTQGNKIQLIFTAPYAGKYKLIPSEVAHSGGKSMLLAPKSALGSSSVAENYTQTFTVLKNDETVWSKKLSLSAQNKETATADIDSNIVVELEKGQNLVFEFKSPESWAQCDLYVNFNIALTEYILDDVSGVYFPQENYLISKNSNLQLSPVIVPGNVANSNVSYTVSDESILSVDSTGKVTPKSAGYTTVTVTTEEGGFTDSAIVAVYEESSPSYSAKALYQSAVDKLGSLDSVKTVDNDIVSQWNTLYKDSDGYVKHEKLTYTDWNTLAFHAADKDYHGNASTVMVSNDTLSLYYGRQDTNPHGTAIEFTAPEYGIYALTSDGNNGMISLLEQTVSYIGSSSTAKFEVNFYINDVIKRTVELSATHTSETFPELNYLELQKDDKVRIEFITNCWERGGIAVAPKIVRVLEEPKESPVTCINLSETEITLSKNGTKTLLATVLPIYADNKELIYESADIAIAKVDDTGVVTAVGVGETVIKVKSKKYPDVTAECKVKIAGPSYNVISSLKTATQNIQKPNTMYDLSLDGLFSAGVLTDGEYYDFKYVVNHWGSSARLLTNIKDDTGGNKSRQFIEFYNDQFIHTGSLVADSWVYTGFTVDADGIYTFKPSQNYSNIELAYSNGAVSANDLISWGEDYPVYIRITKNGEKIWPLGDTVGYELKPSGNQSVAMPELKDLELYKGDVIRVEVLGQDKVARHLLVRYNYGIEMQKSIIPDVNVQQIILDKVNCELIEGETVKLSANVYPENATNKNVYYVSSDAEILTVSAGGVVTAAKAGSATVYAISCDNGEIKAFCDITVLEKGPSYNVVSSLKKSAEVVKEANTMYDARFDEQISAGILSDGEYSDFKGVVNQWSTQKVFTNNTGDLNGTKSNQFVEFYTDQFVQTGSWVANSWVYTGFTVDADGIYTFKPNSSFKNITLAYVNGAENADALISWGEDYPIYVRITKNGEKIWPLGDTAGYELKPSGNQSVATPELKDLELYKGDVIRVEVLGQNSVGRHLVVRYNYDIDMRKSIDPAVNVTGIILDKASCELYTGDSVKLSAKVVPENASNKNVYYTSSAPSIVSVTPSGLVTALKQGNATVYAVSYDNGEIKDSCEIKSILKGPSYNVISSLKKSAEIVDEPKTMYEIKFNDNISAGVLSAGEYSDFKYAVHQWGENQKLLTNNQKDISGSLSNQFVEFYTDDFVQTGSLVANSWVYTGFTVNEDGIYNFKPNKKYPNIQLIYSNGAVSPNDLISWGEDYPLYVRITKNGEKIWPLGDSVGYELKPSGNQSVAMPELKDLELYKGDVIRVEVLGQNKVGRHLLVRYNYDVEMLKSVVPAVGVKGVSLDKTSYELSINQSVKLSSKVTPENATNKNVYYESSNPDVVTVSPSGVVTALKQGEATVYAISYDNDEYRAACNITVSSYKIIDYTPLDLFPSIERQLDGKIAVTSYPIEFDTNWSAQGLNAKGKWNDAYNLTTYDWNNDKVIDCREFGYGWKNAVGIEGKQPFLLSETGTVSLVFTATRAGTYKLAPDPEKSMISIPNTFLTTRVPEKDKDKLWTFKIYNNDKELFSTQLSCKGVNSVEFPTIENLEMVTGDTIRFVLEVCEEAESQMDIWFAPVISLITPSKKEYAPIGTDREYLLDPDTSINGKIKAVHPNGIDIYYEDISRKSANKLEIAADGTFTYTPAKGYKGIDVREIRLSDYRGNTSVVKLRFIVCTTYDGAQTLRDKLLSFDPEATGVVQNMTYDDAVWRFQYSYDGLTYPNGSPKYYDSDLAECIENPGWKGYTAYTNGMPQATVYYISGVPVVEIMAGEKPWNTSPVGAMTFIAPYDGTYLLRGNEKFNKFLATNAANNGVKQPIKVWISKNGQKIWPVNDTAIELNSENPEIEFPELQIAMKKDDTIKICVSGHPANWRKNTVAIAPMIYDIGAYNLSLDPVTSPEGGVIIIDDDGEPKVRYSNFSLRTSKKSVDDDPFIEPIIDKNYTLNKIKKLKKVEAFKMSATYKECVDVDNYLINVYRKTDYGYELFGEQSTNELKVEMSDFIAGDYTIQVLALDKRGQYLEIYTARNFTVDEKGNFKFEGQLSIVTLIIIISSITLLAAIGGTYIFIIRKRR